jgi:hypothetical protein
VAQDTVQADAILKNYYLPVLREMINQRALLLFGYSPEDLGRGAGSMNASEGESMPYRGISRDATKVEFAGRKWVFTAHTKRNESGTMRDEPTGNWATATGAVLPPAGQQGWEDFEDKVRRAYKQIQISGFSLAVSERSLGSYLRLLESETEGAVNDLRKDLNRQGFGDQTGALAAITADGVNTITVDNLQYLRVGMQIDIVNKSTDAVLNAAGGVTITAINTSTRVVTYSGTDLTTTPGTHVPALQGNWKREMNGLRNFIRSDVYPILHATDASTAGNEYWRGKFVDGANTTFDEDQGQLLLDNIGGEGKETQIIITTRGVRRRYANTLKAQKRFNDALSQTLHGGFKYLDFNGYPMLYDDDCPKQHAFFLTPDDFLWIWLQANDFQWMQRDGAVLRKIESPDLDAYKATLYKYMDFGCTRRNTQGAIYNLADDIP